MSVSPGIAGLVEKLPADKRGSYEKLIRLTRWLLDNPSETQFLLAKVGPALGLKGQQKRLGCLLRSLGLRSRKTSCKGKRGNLWSRKRLLNLLHIHGIVCRQKGAVFALNPRITGNFHADAKLASVYPFRSTKPNPATAIDVNLLFYPSFSIRPYHAQEIEYWEQNWKERFIHKSFSSALLVVQTLLENCTPEDHGAIVNGQPDMCWTFHNGIDASGYAHVTKPWLNTALPGSEILPQDLLSTGAHRLVMMVQMPGLDWKDARFWPTLPKAQHGMLAHHSCFRRNCINPSHVEPLTRDQHEAVHKNIDASASRKIIIDIVRHLPAKTAA